MRRFFAVLALAALVAACSDQPTQPSVEKVVRPSVSKMQSAKWGDEKGAWAYRWPAGCGLWGWDGELLVIPDSDPVTPVLYPYKGAYAPSGVFSWQCYVEKIPNPTGRTLQFGPDNWPASSAGFLEFYFGVTPIEGRLPNCDIDLRRYPTGYAVIPVPEESRYMIQCTWNWRYTITASGEARFSATYDPGNSWYPFP